VSYEDLCDDDRRPDIMKRLWRFLGVDDDVDATPLTECIKQSSEQAPLRDSILNYDEVEFAYRCDERLRQFFDCEKASSAAGSNNGARGVAGDICHETTAPFNKSSCKTDASFRWALIVPVRAGSADTLESCRERLESFCISLTRTVSNASNTILLFGVDDDDPLYTDRNLSGSSRQDLSDLEESC